MLTKEEKDFIRYWEENRLRRKKLFRQLLVGIPAGLLIVVPIVINLESGWYKRATMEANSSDFNPMVLLVALLLIVGFSAIFWQRHQWDQYEQRYRELLATDAEAGGTGRTEWRGDAGSKGWPAPSEGFRTGGTISKIKPRRWPGLLAGSSWLLHIKQLYIKIWNVTTFEAIQ